MRLLKVVTPSAFLFTQVAAVLPVTTSTTMEDEPVVQTVTCLTKALPLYPGEGTNSFHHIPIPKGRIVIYEFAANMFFILGFSLFTGGSDEHDSGG
jgi:hypothetical protein